MVNVVVVRPFCYMGRNVFPGTSIMMSPIEAASKSWQGYVSLLHGNTYQTREMVAETQPTVEVFIAPSPTTDTPVKRRRGRGRKRA